MEAQKYRETETEGLIREYQKNAKLTQAAMKLLEWRKMENRQRSSYE